MSSGRHNGRKQDRARGRKESVGDRNWKLQARGGTAQHSTAQLEELLYRTSAHASVGPRPGLLKERLAALSHHWNISVAKSLGPVNNKTSLEAGCFGISIMWWVWSGLTGPQASGRCPDSTTHLANQVLGLQTLATALDGLL